MAELGGHSTSYAIRRSSQIESAVRGHAQGQGNLRDIGRLGYAPKAERLAGRQLEIAQLVALGLADKEIAHYLAVSQSTVKAHVSNILRGLGLYRRTQICRFVYEAQLLAQG